MTAQHTPGPWQLDELGIIYSGDCTELCARHSNDHVVAIVTDARPEDRRLIAAAPLMLEALLRAVHVGGMLHSYDCTAPMPKDCPEHCPVGSAHRAIAAATGEDA